MKRFLHPFGYLICVALLLILCAQSRANDADQRQDAFARSSVQVAQTIERKIQLRIARLQKQLKQAEKDLAEQRDRIRYWESFCLKSGNFCTFDEPSKPLRTTLKRVQTGVQKVCFGDHCEMVPQYGWVQVAEPNCDQPPPALPIVTPDCQCVDCTCDPCECPPPAPMATVDELAAVQQRMMVSRPVRSWVESRPVMRLFAAKPLRSFLRRIFVR